MLVNVALRFHGATLQALTFVRCSDQRCDNYVSALEQSMKDALRYLRRGLLTITEEEDLWKPLMQRYSGTES